MKRVAATALLVALTSCQFGSDRSIELLPVAEEEREDDEDGGSGRPRAELGAPPAETVEEALALRLAAEAARAREAQQSAEAARAAKLEAAEAAARAEQERLTAEAALVHERKQRRALEDEREFLLGQVREFESRLHQAEVDAARQRALEERVAELELELYEARVYEEPAAEHALAAAIQALRAAVARDAEAGRAEFFAWGEEPGVRLSGSLLFASGEVELGEEGVAALTALAADLAPLVEGGAQVHVRGHTDPEPVRAQAERFPFGNLQLSARRALVVAQCLVDAGLPSEALSVSGLGPLQPLVSNDTPEGRARNRRVEILVRVPHAAEALRAASAPPLDPLEDDPR